MAANAPTVWNCLELLKAFSAVPSSILYPHHYEINSNCRVTMAMVSSFMRSGSFHG
jgi:hypothetical protein